MPAFGNPQASSQIEAQNLASRLDLLHANGHDWMDPVAQTSLAASSNDNNTMLKTADTYRSVSNMSNVNPDHVLSSSIVPQTAWEKAVSFFHNVYQHPPGTTNDLTSIQTSLQQKGYGKDLAVGTVWDGQWSNAMRQYHNDQLTAPGFGNVSAGKVLGKTMAETMPSNFLSQLVHFVEALPAEAVKFIADTAANPGGGVGGALLGFYPTGRKQAAETAASIQTGAANAAANLSTVVPGINAVTSKFKSTTAEQVFATQRGRSLDDVLNVLQFVGATHVAMDLAAGVKGVGVAMAPNVAADASIGEKIAAVTKAIAKNPTSLITKSLPENFANTPRLTVVKSLYQGGAAEGKGSGILNALNKLSPFEKRILPAFDNYISKDGSLYFQFKNKVAQWARNPIRNIGAQTQVAGMKFGLSSLATSEAEDTFAKDPSQPVDLAHTAPYSGIMGTGLNGLSMLAGSPTGVVKASQSAATTIKNSVGVLEDMLGHTHIDYAIKSGLGIDFNELKNSVGVDKASHYINGMLNQFAATHWAKATADEEIAAGQLDPSNFPAFKKRMQNLVEVAQNDAQIMHAARTSLLNNPNELATYFKKEMFNYAEKRVIKNVDGPFELGPKGKARLIEGIKNYYKSFDKITEVMKEENRHMFSAGKLEASIEDARSAAIADHFGKTTPNFDPANPASPKLFRISRKPSVMSPTPDYLSRNTPYGEGVPATDDYRWAGRTAHNVYSLQHVPLNGQPAKFLDMSQKGNTLSITKAMRDIIGGNQGRTVSQNMARQELLIGEGKQKTVEYNALRNMLKDSFSHSPQDVADAYRKALVAAGRLDKKAIDARVSELVKTAVNNNGYTGFKYYDNKYGFQHVINPDRVTAVRANIDPKLSRDNFITSNNIKNHTGRGQLSFINTDTLSRDKVQDFTKKFFNRLVQNGHKDDVLNAESTLQLEGRSGQLAPQLPTLSKIMDPEDVNIWQDAFKVAQQLGWDPAQTSKYDVIELVSALYRASKELPAEAKLLPNASPELQKLIEDIKNETGMIPALGTGIGHTYEAPLIHPLVIEAHTTAVRKAANNIGLGLDPIKDQNTASVRQGIRANAIDKAALTGRVKLAYNDTGSRILSILSQGAKTLERAEGKGKTLTEDALISTGKVVKRLLTVGRDQPAINKIFNESVNVEGMTSAEIAQARAEFEKSWRLTNDSERTIRDLSPRQMVRILTQPVNPESSLDLGFETPRYTKQEAWNIVRTLLAADAKMPATYVGLGKVEDMLRASGAIASDGAASFLGKVPLLRNKNIDKWGLWNITASLPADLVHLRDRFRFDLNPLFGMRRMVKTNLKAALEGVPVSSSPYLSLLRQDKLDSARAILARTMPEYYKSLHGSEELDKTLAQNDVFNFYNPIHNMMWQAQHLKEMGLTDAEIAKKLERINTYGDRTGFEKSIATVFYPFSFNKTLYRNIGGYLLDNPGKAMLTNVGLQLWQHGTTINPNIPVIGGKHIAFNENNAMGKWLDEHFPLITELKKLNAFDHGIGLGQLGGINAPYLQDVAKFKDFMNMFGPQAVTPQNAASMSTLLKQLIPAWSEINSLLWGRNAQTGESQFGQGALPGTLRAGWYELKNKGQHFADDIAGRHRDITGYQETMVPTAQQQAGMDFVTSAKGVLAGHILAGDTWDSIPNAPADLLGQKINTTSIEQYANILYPAYIPGASVSKGLAKASEVRNIISSMKGDSTYYDAYKSFYDQAEYVLAILKRSKDYAKISDLSEQMRTKAVFMAEHDPRFINFYNKFYASALGPIEKVK
jgi:hypothetical protein